jgi:hypothetical protein
MKKILLPFLLLLVVVVSLTAANAPRVGRATLVSVENNLNERISKLWDDNPFLVLGKTRGVYLENYGAVFTAEVDLVANPTSLMHANVNKDEVVKFHQKKVLRIPILKQALKDALVATAASLDTVPPEEQIIIVAFLANHPSWEDLSGIPTQITVQAPRKKLLDAQRGGAAAVDAVIRVTEN